MQIKIMMRYHLTPVRKAILNKSINNKQGEGVEKREPSLKKTKKQKMLPLTLKHPYALSLGPQDIYPMIEMSFVFQPPSKDKWLSKGSDTVSGIQSILVPSLFSLFSP